MLYKHWRKIALALTGFFWASCDSDTTSANGSDDPSSSSVATPESSSSVNQAPVSSSSEATEESSSSSTEVQKQSSSSEDFGKIVPLYGIEYEKFVSSSSTEESSSSFTEIMPAYGVPDKIACFQKQGEKTMTCEDGTVCTQVTEERWAPEFPCADYTNDDGELVRACPDYGVVQISENTYECDGVKYNEAQFRARYEKRTVVEDPEQDTTFNGEMQPALYGPPCVFNGTCDDAEK